MAEKPLPINPFRPGAGQQPVYLAGRTTEQDTFKKMLDQDPVSQNVIVTGLRGVGKTVLLESLKPIAQSKHWLWTGNDLSESVSLTEERVARRIVVDLSTLLGPLAVIPEEESVGFLPPSISRALSFEDLWRVYESTPGLVLDKIKAVFAQVGKLISQAPIRGIVFAYDEAQNLADHAADKEFPLSLLLDLFSYLQRTPQTRTFMLVLSGLPTLFPKLNEARTYTERMFHVLHLRGLDEHDAHEAIEEPLRITKSPLRFSPDTIELITQLSGGYPFFIQFIGKEVFDAWIGRISQGEVPSVPIAEIEEKLDQDFFMPRWVRATDRQQQFMQAIAHLTHADEEFSAQEIVTASKDLLRAPFTPSHAAQILQALAERGLVYRNRRAGYCFAVPMMAGFIRRQPVEPTALKEPPGGSWNYTMTVLDP